MIELLALPALTTLGAAGLELAAKFDPVPTMARVRIFGSIFPAKVLKDNGDGTYQMEAKQASARTAVGTVFTATQAEVVEMAAAEIPGSQPAAATTPPAPNASAPPAPHPAAIAAAAALEAAMAEERKTLPTPADLLAAFRQDKGIVTKGQAATPAAPASTGVSVPAGPTAALPAPKPAGSTHMPHLADKLKQLATGTSGFVTALEAKVDAALADHAQAQSDINQQVDDAFAKVDAINADAKAGVAAITAELAKVTN